MTVTVDVARGVVTVIDNVLVIVLVEVIVSFS